MVPRMQVFSPMIVNSYIIYLLFVLACEKTALQCLVTYTLLAKALCICLKVSKQGDQKEGPKHYKQQLSVECNIQIAFKVSQFHSNESQTLSYVQEQQQNVLLLLIGPFRSEYNCLHRGE